MDESLACSWGRLGRLAAHARQASLRTGRPGHRAGCCDSWTASRNVIAPDAREDLHTVSWRADVDRVVATAQPQGGGLWRTTRLSYGEPAPELRLRRATVAGLDESAAANLTLGMSAYATAKGYALAADATSDPRGLLLGVLKTTDGGATWEACPTAVTGTNPQETPTLTALAGGQGVRLSNRVDVDPAGGDTAVIGWVDRFITHDGGSTWQRFLRDNPHASRPPRGPVRPARHQRPDRRRCLRRRGDRDARPWRHRRQLCTPCPLRNWSSTRRTPEGNPDGGTEVVASSRA